MDPVDPPRLHGAVPGTAVFKTRPEDFVVEERLGFEPSGDGEHCFLWVEKIGLNSNEVATILAQRLGLRRRLVSHCGMKDRNAVARQWFSLHLPGQDSPQAAELECEGLKVLRVSRNLRKLRRGSHRGNRFEIRLRECGKIDPGDLRQRWDRLVAEGVPNYFGPQRFGSGGDNIRQARQMLSGAKEVRDRELRGILISAARSFLFNAVIGERVASGSWRRVLEGEVFGFADNRSLILPEKTRGDEGERFSAGEIHTTAPLWGQGELLSVGEVRELERSVVAQFPELVAGLEGLGLRQERRVMRLQPEGGMLEIEGGGVLRLSFDLPKGAFATTVLRELVDLDSRG